MISGFKKYISVVTLLAILMVAVLGISSVAIEMNNGSMSHCPLMGASFAMCPMKVADHISIWQSLLAVTVPGQVDLMLMLAALLVILIGLSANILSNFVFLESYERFSGLAPNSRLNNQLIEIFSQGIIHPKKYSA